MIQDENAEIDAGMFEVDFPLAGPGYSALSLVFSTNVVCVKTQQKHARIQHHDRTKQK